MCAYTVRTPKCFSESLTALHELALTGYAAFNGL